MTISTKKDETNTKSAVELIEADVIAICSLRDLKKINKESIKRNYNRTLNFDACCFMLQRILQKSETLVWSGLKSNVLLKPKMIHKHAAGEECEEHLRCFVYPLNFIIDVDLESYNQLKKHAA